MDSIPLNRMQRWVLDRSALRYAKLAPELRPIAMERDKFLFSTHSLGLWAGVLFGTLGSTRRGSATGCAGASTSRPSASLSCCRPGW